jgi:hypothetical protein
LYSYTIQALKKFCQQNQDRKLAILGNTKAK